MKNERNIDLFKELCNLEYKITAHDIKSAALWLFLPSLIPIIAFIILMGLNTWILGAILSMMYFIPVGAIIILDMIVRHIKYKKSLRNIRKILNNNTEKIPVTEEDLLLCDVLEIENKKDKVTLKNGKKAKRRRVTDYIILSESNKLKIIKQFTKSIKRGLYKKVERHIELLNDNDLVTEGLTTIDGKLTEKAKSLGLRLY